VTEEQVLAELRGLLAGLTDEDMATVTQGMLFQQLQDQLGGRVALSPFRAAVRREVDSFLCTPRKPCAPPAAAPAPAQAVRAQRRRRPVDTCVALRVRCVA